MRLPSGVATMASSVSALALTVACAASGTWQLPPKLRDSWRSARTASSVPRWFSGASSSIRSLRPAQISMAIAPCPGAGRLSAGSITERMRAASPRRFRPAAARMIAAYSPRSSFARRVSRLPRSGCMFRCGKRADISACLRRLLVPTTAPAGRSARLL